MSQTAKGIICGLLALAAVTPIMLFVHYKIYSIDNAGPIASLLLTLVAARWGLKAGCWCLPVCIAWYWCWYVKLGNSWLVNDPGQVSRFCTLLFVLPIQVWIIGYHKGWYDRATRKLAEQELAQKREHDEKALGYLLSQLDAATLKAALSCPFLQSCNCPVRANLKKNDQR